MIFSERSASTNSPAHHSAIGGRNCRRCMLIFADGIGAGNLDLAERPQRFVEPREKISYRAEKSQRPIARLYALVISNLGNVREALQFLFEFVGGGGHFHSSLSVSGWRRSLCIIGRSWPAR